jgi:DNA uptake protein ComE-like DNA-binding protein
MTRSAPLHVSIPCGRRAPRVPNARRGFAVVLVMWIVALVAVVIVSLQATAWRDAGEARQVVAKVRAQWAARAGVEAAIAELQRNTLSPDTGSATTITTDLEAVATGDLDGASFTSSYYATPQDAPGAADAHAKININLMDAESLLLLPNMTEDIADAILDWIDADDDPLQLGAESASYALLASPYAPRNGPMRSIQELELVIGVRPDLVRGEDWNLNGRLDPNENDGDASWPPDNADNVLDAGWSQYLTAGTVDGPSLVDSYGLSGEKRLDLTTAGEQDIQQRLSVDLDQARAILAAAASPGVTFADFISTDISDLATSAGQTINPAPADLTDAQLAALLEETVIPVAAAADLPPGKLNLNTAPAAVLEYLPGLDPAAADVLNFERQGKPQGFATILDLLEVPAFTRARLAELYPQIQVRSSVYRLTVTGRDTGTGLEVEMVAELDRSTIPVRILSLRTR